MCVGANATAGVDPVSQIAFVWPEMWMQQTVLAQPDGIVLASPAPRPIEAGAAYSTAASL